jgi:catechol 2,3-dioxygenase-like lactoylglutathione lyase family enzyme
MGPSPIAGEPVPVVWFMADPSGERRDSGPRPGRTCSEPAPSRRPAPIVPMSNYRRPIGGRAVVASHLSKPPGTRCCHPVPVIKRVVAYANGDDVAASRDFYVEVIGLQVAMEDPVLGLSSPSNPTAQVLIPPQGMENPPPRFGIDVGDPDAVDAAHAEAVRRGLRVVYPLTTEPWGVRRFFVEDPGGTVVNVLAHLP